MSKDTHEQRWVVDATNYLNICAHCGECLKQIVASPDKVNAILYCKDDSGTIVPWKPEDYTKQAVREARKEELLLRISDLAWAKGKLSTVFADDRIGAQLRKAEDRLAELEGKHE